MLRKIEGDASLGKDTLIYQKVMHHLIIEEALIRAVGVNG